MQEIQELVLVLVPMILSLTVHEYSHALSARWLGDRTATLMGRLTLNPLPHIDLVGTILLPAMAVFANTGFFFGWAKPVPVNPTRFSRRFGGNRVTMRAGMAITGFAGPASNLVFGFLSATFLAVLIRLDVQFAGLLVLLKILVHINFLLAIFNMIPIPPLDGSKVLAAVLPPGARNVFDFLERNVFFAMILLIGLISTGVLGYVIGPAMKALFSVTEWILQIPLNLGF